MSHQTPISVPSCLFTLCAATACIPLEGDELDDFDEAELRALDDPAVSSVFDVCSASPTLNGLASRIRYPEGQNCWMPIFWRPVVLVLHGNGYGYDEYDYLLDHLAANGFVAVSIDYMVSDQNNTEIGHQAGAEVLELVLDDLLTDWGLGWQIDASRLAIVGHSRGAQTARYLADELADPTDSWTVRAVVGLASAIGSNFLRPLSGDETDGFLLLQGAADADQNPEDGFVQYDGTGVEGSITPAADSLDKAMKLLEAGTHQGFAGQQQPAQALVTQGYVLAFLAMHLLDDTSWYEDYIRGDDVPFGWPDRVVSQYSDGTQRMVVDNFEDGLFTAPTIGGTISKSLTVSASVRDLGAEPSIHHETEALKFSGQSGDYIEWSFANTDFDDYGYLSFRVGQLDDLASKTLSVSLRNNGVWLRSASTADHGEIPTLMDMCLQSDLANQLCGLFDEFGHMGTIRVPLSEFGGRNNVDGVRVYVDAGSGGTNFVLDSLEFSQPAP